MQAEEAGAEEEPREPGSVLILKAARTDNELLVSALGRPQCLDKSSCSEGVMGDRG